MAAMIEEKTIRLGMHFTTGQQNQRLKGDGKRAHEGCKAASKSATSTS
jgi:hypothetical protein